MVIRNIETTVNIYGRYSNEVVKKHEEYHLNLWLNTFYNFDIQTHPKDDLKELLEEKKIYENKYRKQQSILLKAKDCLCKN